MVSRVRKQQHKRENIMITLSSAIFTGYTDIELPAQFKVVTKTINIGGVEYPQFFDFYDVKNGDDFIAGEEYDIELVDGIATVVA